MAPRDEGGDHIPNRLKPLNQFDFTGGINLRPETFQLTENELPELLNLEVDPRGGLNVRKGWRYVNPTPVATGTWNPRNAYAHIKSNGDRLVLVANQDTANYGPVYGRVNDNPFTAIATVAAAMPHLADFASWDDLVWGTRGAASAVFTWDGSTVTTLTFSGWSGNWQNDYTAPGSGKNAPLSELIAQHAGYMFVAGTTEDATNYPNRLRWSHPNNPYAWASHDYIDLSEGGQKITAMIPFSDRLLIFKSDSVWALFGSDAETWELTNISRTVGCTHQQAITRNESAVFFLSWPQGVFAYSERGNVDEISVPIRAIFQNKRMRPDAIDNVWFGWVDRRLWCSLPFHDNPEVPGWPIPTDAATVFVWDPVLSENGSWTMFRGHCTPGPYLERVDTGIQSGRYAFTRQAAHMVVLDEITEAATDECKPGEIIGFETRFRTRWIDAGAPTWRKSWRRPDLLLRALKVDTLVNCRVFHDYNSMNAERSFQVAFTPDLDPAIYGDFNWGDGHLYGGAIQTTSVERGGTMGRAGTVQLLVEGEPGNSWGLNGVVFKFIPRRFR